LKNVIRILNPSHGSAYTTRRAAERHVNRGRARWQGENSIRFAEESHEHQSVTATTLSSARGYDRANRILSREEVRQLPALMPDKLMSRTNMYASTRWMQARRRYS